MKFFLDHGWCKKEGNSLIFISKEKLRLKYDVKVFCNIQVQIEKTIGHILNDLRYELLKERQRRFDYTKQLSIDQSNPDSVKSYKRALKHEPIGEMNERYAVSLYTLADQLGLSISSVSRLIKPRCKEKWNRVLCLGVGVMYCDGFYNYSGKVFRVIMNEYSF